MSEDPKDASENQDGPDQEGLEDPIPQSAIYSPDDPIARAEGEIPREALYSPDDPVKQADAGDGIVTNLGGREIRNSEEARSLLWEIRLAADLLEVMARDLRDEGLGALKLNPGAEPLDVMIRSFIAGYLIGKMDEDG